MTAHPINGVTAPDTLPITVFNVYFRFDQNVYNTTYVNQPINPKTAASIVVIKSKIIPKIELTIPAVSTVFKEKLPVTVGRSGVRIIFSSKSTSYQLFNMRAPAISNVPPISMERNLSQNIIKLESVKYNANQNPLKIGRTLAISTIPLTSDFRSLKKPFTPCFLKSFSILNSVFVYILKCTHLLSCLIICIACK